MDKETEVCFMCGKEFKKSRYLLTHFKQVHKTDIEGNPLPNSEELSFQCLLCEKVFSRKGCLKSHVTAIHFPESVETFKCTACEYSTKRKFHLKRHIQKMHSREADRKRAEKKFECSKCNAIFKHKSSLVLHGQKKHYLGKRDIRMDLLKKELLKKGVLKKDLLKIDLLKKDVIKRKCPLCSFNTSDHRLKSIYLHFKETHNISLKWENYSFGSMDDFYDWKKRIEKQSVSSYIIWNKYSNTYIFQCRRSGTFKPSGANKRSLKMIGTCKINGFCPSRIKVVVRNNCVTALYQSVHVGHKHELKHIRLSEEERNYLASKLMENMPHKEILNGIRASFPNSDLQRIHLVTKSDLENIERDFRINKMTLIPPKYPSSIESRVMNLNKCKDTALVFYKRKGETNKKFPSLNENDFMLIFMTIAQVSFLKRFGKDTVYIDGTHGSSDFHLYTILVLDEGREGFPVGFMFCNKGDENSLRIFFEKVQTVAGKIKPNVFMSDLDETSYTVWKNTMGLAKHRIFCSKHVLTAWRLQISNKIKSKEQRKYVYKILKCLLYELDVQTFMKQLDGFLNKLESNEDTLSFYNYFQQDFVENKKYFSWAYCYRANIGINTNISLANFDKVLKRLCLNEKNVEELDKTLCDVLKLLKDELFNYIITIEKGRLVRKLQILRQRHKRSIIISEDNAVESDNKWNVLSSSRIEFYTVKRIKHCKTCHLQCFHCDSCFHEFNCSCADNTIKNNMCEHIHLVARKIMKEGRKFGEIYGSTELEDDWLVKEVDLEEVSDKEISNNFEEEKQKLLTEASKISQFIEDNCSTIDQIDFMRKTIEDMMVATKAMTS